VKPASAPSALKVQTVLGDDYQVLEFEAGTRTAADAAAAVGCSVAQIAKSLIFRTKETNRAVLVVASGANRVDEKRIAAEIGERIVRADADFVREATGFAIGGVPPVGHKTPPITLIDDDLFPYETIWAAAGTPNAVFQLTPERLADLTGGQRSRIAQNAAPRD
jgi:prolyl-tRNA editing enzyme YbaK/EbsC (Cys-tRNA(Pro) deacylase)